MSQQVFSAHPALAVDQLQQAEQEEHNTSSNHHQQRSATQSRRHTKAAPKKFTLSRSCAGGGSGTLSGVHQQVKPSPSNPAISPECRKTLPVRTNYAAVDDDDDIECEDVDEVNFGQQEKERERETRQPTKDCGTDETDHVQQRHKNTMTTSATAASRHHHQDGGGGDQSDLSSVISSPSVSTVSSPLSTPTRLPQALQQQLHCCQKSTGMESRARTSPQQIQHPHRQHHQQQHHHHHHHHHLTAAGCTGGGGGGGGSGGSGSCKAKKLDPRLNPSPYRQLLPIALCLLSFAAVFATLIVYMDTTGESSSISFISSILSSVYLLKFDISGICHLFFELVRFGSLPETQTQFFPPDVGCVCLCCRSVPFLFFLFFFLFLKGCPFPVMGTLSRLVYASSKLASSASFVIDRCPCSCSSFPRSLYKVCIFSLANIFLVWACLLRWLAQWRFLSAIAWQQATSQLSLLFALRYAVLSLPQNVANDEAVRHVLEAPIAPSFQRQPPQRQRNI